MKKELIIIGVIIATLLVVILLVFYPKLTGKEDNTSNVLTQKQAEQAALDANYDWVLELNSLGRAEIYDSSLEGDDWIIRIRNYQRPEDQKGFLIVYKVDAMTGVVENDTKRQEVPNEYNLN